MKSSLLLRLLLLAFAGVLLMTLCCACEDGQSQESSAAASSIELLQEQMQISEESAVSVLAQIYQAGYDGRVVAVFTSEDDEDRTYFRVWMENASFDLYLNENGMVEQILTGDEDSTAPSEVSPTPPQSPSDTEKVGDSSQENTNASSGETSEDSVQDAPPDAPDPPESSDEPPSEAPDVPPTDPDESGDASEPSPSVLRVTSLTSPVAAGKTATLTAQGIAGQEYTIAVRYASGNSTARGLEPLIATSDGALSWSWKVSSRVAAGDYTITVSGGGESVTATLTVTEKEAQP